MKGIAMNTIKVSKDAVEKLFHLIQDHSDENNGCFDDAVEELFPGLLPDYGKKPEQFTVEWE
jgi:hypothetical protein